jgi:SAM-dependent methyltransferase
MLYDEAFFARHTDLQSARIIVPHVLRKVRPNSVVDVGCALGAWLRVFSEHGVQIVQGLDGDYVDRSQLLIKTTDFTPVNLTESIKGDLGPVTGKANGRYDLAICLEVAEHLPDSSASDLVRTLTTLAPVVLFSAAVPGQGGVGHINEQWPGYWKSRFQKHGFQRLDLIRRRIWRDGRVHWWYRRNIFLFAAPEKVAESDLLRDEEELAALAVLYIYGLNRLRKLKRGMIEIPRAMLNAMKNQLPRQARPQRKGERFRSYASKNR